MANTNKELLSQMIVDGTVKKATTKKLNQTTTASATTKKDSIKKLIETTTVSAIVKKDTTKKLNQTTTASAIIRKDSTKKLNQTTAVSGVVKKATERTFSNVLIVTATKEVNDAALTLYYNGNAALELGAQQGAKFDIIVTGTFTTFSITINGKTLTYTENVTSQTITIDNVNATCKNVAVNKMSNLTGDVTEFLTLLPGYNTVTYHKEGGSVDFTFDFRAQYI